MLMRTRAETSAPFIGCETAGTLPGLFRRRVAASPAGPAYRQYEDGEWRDYRWSDMAARVTRWHRALAAEGLAPGERVAVSVPNGVDWVTFDQAALGLGLVTVPLYTTDNPENLAYILADCGARLLLIDRPERWAPLAELRDGLPEIRRVVCQYPPGGSPAAAGEEADGHRDGPGNGRLRRLADWLPPEVPSPADPATSPTDLAGDPDALATLVYTSGTTGRPKGVMLSHRAILSNAEAVLTRIPAQDGDLFLSFLPLAHAFERTLGLYIPMMAGCTVAYARSVELLRHDLLAVRPTVLLSVPRVYDRIYLAIQNRVGEHGPKRRLLDATVELGFRRFRAAQGRGRPPGAFGQLLWRLLAPRVSAPVLARLGGRMRLAVSGGAPLSPQVARFFIGLGLPLTQGYGLTEAAPTVAGEPPWSCVPGSVGRALPGVEVRLAGSGDRNGDPDGQRHGELLVRSPGVMLGYWGLPDATREAIDEDGWLHTGDLAEIDADGYLAIRGRNKEILVMSSGEKVPPGDLEGALTLDPLFEQAMVLGEGRPYLAALLVLAPEVWQEQARRLGLDPADDASLASPQALRAALARVRKRLAAFPAYARPRAVRLALAPWTVENGLLTPTLKLKRDEMERRFADAIAALYRHRQIPAAP